MIDKEKVEEVSIRLLSGILSNPNYNFDNAKKAVNTAVDHAQALVLKLVDRVEVTAEKVAEVADKVGDKVRGSDDAPKPEKTKDPLSDL